MSKRWVQNSSLSIRQQRHRIFQRRATGNRRVRAAMIRLGMLRQSGLCFRCHEPLGEDITLDHIIPISAGGRTIADNVALSHKRCNNEHGDQDPNKARE